MKPKETRIATSPVRRAVRDRP